MNPEHPSHTEYRPSADDKTVHYSKNKLHSKNSVHLSAVSTSNSMEPPSPPPPPPPPMATAGGTSRSTAGEKNNQGRRSAPSAPVLLRIDASAQGMVLNNDII